MKYYVVDGKSITTQYGVRGPHDEVRQGALGGGDTEDKRLKELCDLGILYSGEMTLPESKKAAEDKAAETAKRAAENKANSGKGKGKGKELNQGNKPK